MTRDKIKEGDICTLDESVEYSYNPHKPYEVVVLWHGVNSQPLVTKLDEYKPFWTTYSQLIEVKRHIDLSIKALEQQTCEDAVSREAVLMELDKYLCGVPFDEKSIDEVIKELPPVNPQPKIGWIPVSERLPEVFEFVNCTCHSLIDDRKDWVVETIYVPQLSDSPYSDWGNIPMLNWGHAEVIAWMHRDIPEPYKAEIEPQESEVSE